MNTRKIGLSLIIISASLTLGILFSAILNEVASIYPQERNIPMGICFILLGLGVGSHVVYCCLRSSKGGTEKE